MTTYEKSGTGVLELTASGWAVVEVLGGGTAIAYIAIPAQRLSTAQPETGYHLKSDDRNPYHVIGDGFVVGLLIYAGGKLVAERFKFMR